MAKARAKKAQTPKTPNTVIKVDGKTIDTFGALTNAFVRTVIQIVLSLRTRPGSAGAANYGTDGLFIAGIEAMHFAKSSGSLQDFLKAAAYSVSAALVASGGWEFPLEAPESDEKEPKKETKKKGKKEGKKNGGS